MTITIILQNNTPLDIYINSGHYPYQVVEEMKQDGCENITIEEYKLNCSPEELMEFIKSKTNEQT